MSRRFSVLLGAVLIAGCTAPPPDEAAAEPLGWRRLEPGLEWGVLAVPPGSGSAEGRVRVLRIDPERFALKLLSASASAEGHPRTARGWVESEGLVAAINASMFQADYRTSVSLMRSADHVNNPRLSRDKTVLAFDPVDPELPAVKLIDLECETFDAWKDRYRSLVQSIRMYSCRGQNVWSRQPRRWSTAAIGIDGDGRVLFIHVRTPFSTHDLVELLTELPLDLRGLMYSDGGPGAQLFFRAGGGDYEFVGSFESARDAASDNRRAWPIPNVVGIIRR